MVFSLTRFTGVHNPSIKAVTSSKRPFLNEWLFRNTQNNNIYGFTSALRRKRLFWKWFKDQPEVSSPVSIRVNDTIGEVEFLAPDGTSLGRNKGIQARKFWEENHVRERLKSIWFDALVTGEGFGWQGFLSPEQIRNKTMQFFENLDISTKERDGLLEMLTSKAIDEEQRVPRIFDHVASSTVDIVHDDVEVMNYTQTVGTHKETFLPSEILHFKFQDVDGKVHGHTPISSLHREILLLWFLKENMVSYIRNGGNPDKVFILPDEQANSPNHQLLMDLLTDFNAIENRNGNLALTGNIDVKDLNNRMRDLEYKELALYVTSNIAYALQIPVTRIPYMIGKSQSGGDSGGISDSGYWAMIEADQRKIEDILNTQMFSRMGVRVRFRKRYKLDELRETQALSMRADAVGKIQGLYRQYGKQLSMSKLNSMMDFMETDIEDAQMQLPEQITEQRNQQVLSNNELAGNQERRNARRQEQMNSANSVMNNPGRES